MQQESELSKYKLYYEYTAGGRYIAFMRLIAWHRAVARSKTHRRFVKFLNRSLRRANKSEV